MALDEMYYLFEFWVTAQKGGSTLNDNTCKVVMALIALASTITVAYKEIRLAEISANKG